MLIKILKWLGLIAGGLTLLILVFYVCAYLNVESRANKVYEVQLQKLTIPTDSISLAAGEHIATNRGCKGCHLSDLSGGFAFADDKSPIGILYSANITSGTGGIQYSDDDWIRALRHGLDKNNKSLWFMPSHDLYQLTNEDMSNLIAYVKTRPAVDKKTPTKSLKPLGRIITFLGKFPLFPAEKIDHNATYIEKLTPSVSPAYGKYLATTCSACHGKDMKGGEAHGPGQPPIPDITSTGNPGKWNNEGFAKIFKTGITPEGKKLDATMPWKDFTYTRDELQAIYNYLHGLP
jgi:mono/diheme cytochrome c family protein